MNNHLKTTIRAVEGLMEAIKATAKGNLKNIPLIIERVERAEEEADGLRRRLMEELAREELSPVDREDLMHLVKRVDMVADWCRESARILRVIHKRELSKTIKNAILNMMKGVEETALALQKAINQMSESPEKTLEAADKVERLEEKVDELYEKARFALAECTEAKVGVMILIGNLLETIEGIADSCEDACDQIRVIIVRRRSLKK